MAITLQRLYYRLSCLCKRIEDLETTVAELEAGGGLPLFTEGSVLFAAPDGSITEDNASFFYDNANNRVGIGTTTPDVALHVVGSFKLRPGAIILYGTPSIDFAQTWNAASTITGFSMAITDTLSNSDSLFMDLSVGGTSRFKVRKDGRIITAETVNFTNALTQQTTPVGFLTLSGSDNGTVQYSTIDNLQTALGIGVGALTAGYIAYGTGTGITGESGFFYDATNNRMGIGTNTPTVPLHISSGAASGVIILESDNSAYMSIYRYSNNVTRPRYETYKARGTKATPLVIQTIINNYNFIRTYIIFQ